MKLEFSILGVFALSACQMATTDGMNSGGDAVPTQLSSMSDFEQIIGKELRFMDDNIVVINSDGTVSGDFGGTPLAGTWEIKDGYWCRTLTSGPRGPSPEDCQLFILSGDVLSITRDRGNGASFEYIVS